LIINEFKKDVLKMYIGDFLQCLESKVGSSAKRVGNGFNALCPAHRDTSPSLSIAEASNGKILLKCFAGCGAEEICNAIGLEMTALFPERDKIQEYADGKIEYIYQDEGGKPLYKKIRTEDKKFCISSYSASGAWEKGLKCDQRVLYHLPEVLKAKEMGTSIFLVEGEKDAERLRLQGIVATTPIEGAGSSLREEYVSQLEGSNIVLLYDEDIAGYKRRDQWLSLLERKVPSLKVVKLPGLEFQEKSGQDVSDWLRNGHTIKELFELVEKTEEFQVKNQSVAQGLVTLNIQEFLTTIFPERKMILEPIIPSQGLALLYSERGVGKTFLALSIGYAIASGTSFLKWKCETSVKVLYVDGEMPANLMQDRMTKLIAGFGVDLKDPSYFRLITPERQENGIPDISTEYGQKLVEAVIWDAKLVILDNLSTLAPGMQENEADAWAPIQTWILKLRTKGVSVLLVHHAGRSGRPRGTSRREDALDTVIKLKHSDSYAFSEGASFEVHIEKARSFFGDDAEPFIANLAGNENGALCWKIQEVQDDLYDEVIEGILQNKSYRELAKGLTVSKAKIEGLVKKARDKGDLPEVKGKK
jgi:hypothetical protein